MRSMTNRGASGAEDDGVSTHYCSRPRLASLAACETTCGVQAGVIHVLRQTAPPYLADIVSTRVNEFHATQSSLGRSQDLMELRCRTTRYGKRSFPASAPLIWNPLPTTVRDVSTSMNSFSHSSVFEL